MHAIVSLLPEPYEQEVQSLWNELEDLCGLKGIHITPYPHFSWQVAKDYDFNLLDHTLEEIAHNTRPIIASTTGLGLFTGPRPVIYIRVVKSTPLVQFHQNLWQRTAMLARGISAYYGPDLWIPHISLASEDVNASNIVPVIEYLAFRPFTWEMQVNNIALIFQPAGEKGTLHSTYDFKG